VHDQWQTDKKPSSHSIADVFLTEAAAWAAFHSISSSGSASEAPLYPDCDHEATDPKIKNVPALSCTDEYPARDIAQP
jgi:hypothetical protein